MRTIQSLAALCSRVVIVLVLGGMHDAHAQADNLLPKYGPGQKTERQLAADEKFRSQIDAQAKGDRKQAAQSIADSGWQLYRQGSFDLAMKRFNQAWLLDAGNGSALWGMAALEARRGKTSESQALLREAEQALGYQIGSAAESGPARAQGD